MELPVLTIASAEAGPAVAVCANIHGDEVTGMAAVHELSERLPAEIERGAVHLYPTLNPAGLASVSRGLGPHGPDLNRQFPGKRGGSFAARLANAIWRDLSSRELALLVDLHADATASIPYAILDRAVRLQGTEFAEMNRRLLELGRSTGLPVLHEYPEEAYVRFGLDRSLAGAAVNRLRVPAVTIEAGPRRIAHLESVGAVVEAVLRLLAHAGVVRAREGGAKAFDGGPWRRSAGPRSNRNGLFTPRIEAGTCFEAGETIGHVRGLDGKMLEAIVSDVGGVVVSWVDCGWIEAGTIVATLGIAEGAAR